MFENHEYKLWGIFAEEDELIGLAFSLEEATKLRKEAQEAAFAVMNAENANFFGTLEELLQTEQGNSLLGDITIGEFGFNAIDVNFLD